ncbi:MAG TPA: hypothetical protein VK983_01660 [Candidatus Limnocylindrales bacterium]|nr:hypothetical protein [Candidatus Limnocylindrales bacterium]
MEESPPIRHTRRSPEAWDRLETVARGALCVEQSDTANVRPAIAAVSLLAGELSDEELDANRYYGLGEVLVEFAHLLEEPDNYKHLVDQAAIRLAAEVATDRLLANQPVGSLRKTDLYAPHVNPVFDEAAYIASQSLPKETQLVADVLEVVARIRRDSGDMRYGLRSGAHALVFLSEDAVEQIERGEPAARRVKETALSGTLTTLQFVIDAHVAAKSEVFSHRDQEVPRDPLMSAEQIAGLDYANAAARMASLHMDEFSSSKQVEGNRFLHISESDEVQFKREEVTPRPSPDPAHGFTTLHQEVRLGCPALHVNGLMKRMRDMVPDILERAETELSNQDLLVVDKPPASRSNCPRS